MTIEVRARGAALERFVREAGAVAGIGGTRDVYALLRHVGREVNHI